MPKQLDNLLHKEMTRKEFITTISVGVISLFGFSSILKLLMSSKNNTHNQTGNGYGSSAYGGSQRSTSITG